MAAVAPVASRSPPGRAGPSRTRRHPSRPPSRAGRRTAGRDGGARAPRPGRTPPPAWRPPRDRPGGRRAGSRRRGPRSARPTPRHGRVVPARRRVSALRSGRRARGWPPPGRRRRGARGARPRPPSGSRAAPPRSPPPRRRPGPAARGAAPGRRPRSAGASAAQARRSGSRSPVRSSGTAQPRTRRARSASSPDARACSRASAGRSFAADHSAARTWSRARWAGRRSSSPWSHARSSVGIATCPSRGSRATSEVSRSSRSRVGRASSRPVSSAASDGATVGRHAEVLEERPVAVGEPAQDLVAQVGRGRALAPRERGEEAGHLDGPAGGGRDEAEPGGPSAGQDVRPLHLARRHPGPAPRQERRRLRDGEAQPVAGQVDDATLQSQAGQGHRRRGPPGQDQAEAGRPVADHRLELVEHRGVGELLDVVEDEPDLVRERVEHGEQMSGGQRVVGAVR